MINCPVLLLSGESDPFATIELLRDEVAKLRDARLVTYPGVRHGLLPVKDDALDQIADFVRALDQSPQLSGSTSSVLWAPPFLSVPATSSVTLPGSPPGSSVSVTLYFFLPPGVAWALHGATPG